MLKERSIIRNGNHFVHLDGAGWVLIDGPWFDKLPSFKKQIIQYHIPAYSPPGMACIIDEDETSLLPQEFTSLERIVWEKLFWLPGHRTYGGQHRLYLKYRELLSRYRYQVGWRVYPDGKLPIYFNALDWLPEMEFDYYLQRTNVA